MPIKNRFRSETHKSEQDRKVAKLLESNEIFYSLEKENERH